MNPSSRPSAGHPALSVSHLVRPGLIGPVTFSVGPGAALAITGPSGSGKTLLLRALADLDPSDGDVTLNGTPRGRVSAPHWRRRVVYVAPQSGWWSERVGEHFADARAAAPILAALLLPEGALDWPVARLSTGERQRLALARALVLKPDVLLLDEPTSGLDGVAAAAVETLLQGELARGGAIVLVTHDLAQAGRLATAHRLMTAGTLSPAPAPASAPPPAQAPSQAPSPEASR